MVSEIRLCFNVTSSELSLNITTYNVEFGCHKFANTDYHRCVYARNVYRYMFINNLLSMSKYLVIITNTLTSILCYPCQNASGNVTINFGIVPI